MTVGVRVAGRVPTRVDLRFAGTMKQQLGLSLGTVLVYVSSFLAARTAALAWGQAAPLARSLSPVLPVGRWPVVATGPWATSTMVRLFGVPTVDTMLMTARPGTSLPTMLRIQVGPITCELADAAAYTALLEAWRWAADVVPMGSIMVRTSCYWRGLQQPMQASATPFVPVEVLVPAGRPPCKRFART